MKGEIVISNKGEINSSLPLDSGLTEELGTLVSNILQDINTYMRMNVITDLKKTTLRLGGKHEMQVVVGAETIKAIISEI